jgi:hypothetical protein
MEEMNQTQPVTTSYTVTPHPLSGTRQRAEDLLWELPEDLSGVTVIVDASEMKSYAQCFVDELCKQILQVRNADLMKIITENETLKSRIDFSGKIRRFSDRIVFI